MKPGRNDPCPCGSGKKYKQCCMKTEQAQPEDDFLWRRIRRAIEGSPAKLLTFADSHFGREALLEAWDEFMPFDDKSFAPDTPHMPIFMPWFFFDWLPDPENTAVKPEARDRRTLARAYLVKKGRQLDPLYARYLEQCCAAPFSFYDVLSVRPGTGFTLRDIFTGEEVDVTEHAGSQQTQAGDIMLAKLAIIDQVAMLEACAPVMFPPIEKDPILKLRRKMHRRNPAPTPEVLKEYIYEMLGIYHDITDRLLNPPMPQLQNTDGDPLVLNKLIYNLECTPQEAFDALKHLNLIEDDESILAGAKFDSSGGLREIEFTWQKTGNEKHQNWNNTILGHLRIAGATLNAEVNSENRAQKFKTLMEKLLPGKTRYKTTVIQSPQAMLTRAEEEGNTAQSRQRQQEQDELNSLPEVQAQIAEYLRGYYRDWINQKIPVLNNKTPLQAIKTKDGKEMVKALLLEFERRDKDTSPPLDPAILIELRERLGLT
ncbi:MAG: SEC-C metal-binding domain-containing protein [Sideroxyarcus sp.]|nr:SEC-C metal-binding domain-containing protein [Sideroxyarcus sp.]